MSASRWDLSHYPKNSLRIIYDENGYKLIDHAGAKA